MNMKPSRFRAVVLTPGLDGADGIAALSRLVVRALVAAPDVVAPVEVLSLAGCAEAAPHPQVDLGPRVRRVASGGSKVQLVRAVLRRAWRSTGDTRVVCLHVHLSPLTVPFLWRGAQMITVLCGVEAWKPLRSLQRSVLRRSDVVAISAHTARRFRESNPSLATQPIRVCHPALADCVTVPTPDAAPLVPEPVASRADTSFETPPKEFGSSGRTEDLWPFDTSTARAEEAPSFQGLSRSPRSGLPTHPSVEGAPAALIVGRMVAEERYKGHDLLLEIWHEVLERVPGARLWVAGDGDDRRRLQARATQLALQEHVTFFGRVPDDTLARLYEACAFFVMPSRHEGFGFVFLEAMRAGKACIGGIGAAAEIIEPDVTGLLVDPQQRGEVTGAVCRLFHEPETRARMGQAGVERYAREFTEQAFQGRLRALLDRTGADRCAA